MSWKDNNQEKTDKSPKNFSYLIRFAIVYSILFASLFFACTNIKTEYSFIILLLAYFAPLIIAALYIAIKFAKDHKRFLDKEEHTYLLWRSLLIGIFVSLSFAFIICGLHSSFHDSLFFFIFFFIFFLLPVYLLYIPTLWLAYHEPVVKTAREVLTALRRLTPAFIFRKIRFFFFGTTIRKIFTAFFVLLALYLAYNIKTIPNYATKRGYEIVWRDDYEKYNQGYCLVEDRILSEEEVYTRGLRQYLDKNKIATEKSLVGVCELFDFIGHCDYEDQAISVDYYELDKITSLNWYELIHSRAGAENEEKGHREFFFDELNATQVDPKKYLIVDMRSMMAGFSRPITMYIGGRGYKLWLDKAFILNSDQGYTFSPIYIYISENSKFDNYDKESYYYSLQRKKGIGSFRIDNCGNVGLSIEKSVESAVDFTRNGG